MSSIFTKIINREIPAQIVAEDDAYIAFLDINPLAKGHTLVVPKTEVDYIYDLDDQTLSGLHLFCKRVAKAIESVIPCQRIGLIVMGLEIPHAHVHLVPMQSEGDLNFTNPRVEISPEELSDIASRILTAFNED